MSLIETATKVTNQATCRVNEPLTYHPHPSGHIWSATAKKSHFLTFGERQIKIRQVSCRKTVGLKPFRDNFWLAGLNKSAF